jgi:hypothetical protein
VVARKLDTFVHIHAVQARLTTVSALMTGIANATMKRHDSSVEVPGRGDGLKPGDPAPQFSLMGSDGRIHALQDHIGSRAVVLAWFPKAFTGG